jgi:radical SAM protein with 4Fe4S-binding SPASM domain
MNNGIKTWFSKACLAYSLPGIHIGDSKNFKEVLLQIVYANEKYEDSRLQNLLTDFYDSADKEIRKNITLEKSGDDIIIKGYPDYTFILTKGIMNRMNKKLEIKRNTFCHRLWTHATIDESGDVYSCWLKKPQKLGNIHESSLREILNGDTAKQLRKKSLHGTLPCYASCVFDHISKDSATYDSPTIEYANMDKLRVLFSYSCNMRCIMCKQDHLSKNSLDYNTLVDNVDISPFKKIELLGGEPLFIESAKKFFVHAANNKKKVSFLTNGMLIDHHWAKMIALNSAFVHISLNAATKATHEMINKGSNWEKVLANVKRIRYYKKKFGSDVTIMGHMTLIIENLGEITKFIEKFKIFGFDTIEFGYDNRVPVYLSLYPEKKEALKKAISDCLNKSPYKDQIDTTDLDILYLT